MNTIGWNINALAVGFIESYFPVNIIMIYCFVNVCYNFLVALLPYIADAKKHFMNLKNIPMKCPWFLKLDKYIDVSTVGGFYICINIRNIPQTYNINYPFLLSNDPICSKKSEITWSNIFHLKTSDLHYLKYTAV